jgi:hypothetical protein
MAENSKGWQFKRGLDPKFMERLRLLAKPGEWFAHVLADPDLILGIRHNYMNVYWHGQALFKIKPGRGGDLKFSTHPKYLVNPDLSKAVMFTGSAFLVGEHKALITDYRGTETLRRMKRAAKLYAGDEKLGVHTMACLHRNNVIDTEVAFNSEALEEDEPLTPRIDLACFEEVKGEIRLRFWEAKLYDNPELRAEGDEVPVVGQVKRYRKLIEKHREEIVNSYCVVAENLAQLASWAEPPRQVGKLIEEVASDKKTFVIDDPPFVGLAFYGYDAADKASKSWATHIEKLNKAEGMFVRSAGNAKNIKLRGPDSD